MAGEPLEGMAQLFSVLHDGSIERAELEGDTLTLEVAIGYLAQRLSPPSAGFVVTLRGVSALTYSPWADPARAPWEERVGPAAVCAGFDILEGGVRDGTLVVTLLRQGKITEDAGGELSFSAEGLTVHDSGGRAYTVAQLAELARGYWDAWSAKNAPKG